MWGLVPLVEAAPPTLATVFSDDMVLQRDQPLPVWGWADPGVVVTVRFAGKSAESMADAGGKWMVRLPATPLYPLNEKQTLSVSSKDGEITREGILLGDVWIYAGQSNMAFKLGRSRDSKPEADSPPSPLIRFCRATGQRTKAGSPAPRDLESADWKVASRESIADFSAVGYFFGAGLEKSIGVPIGLIDTSVGGTPMRCWMLKARRKVAGASRFTPQGERSNWKYAFRDVSRLL